jgi:hypothetical protein
MKPADLKRIALLMAANCVRNTVIEDYHAQGKLNDAEMMAFNREVANKIYTFLTYMIAKPREDWDEFLGAMSWMYPRTWDQPKFDPDFTAVMKLIKKRRSLPRRKRPDETRRSGEGPMEPIA